MSSISFSSISRLARVCSACLQSIPAICVRSAFGSWSVGTGRTAKFGERDLIARGVVVTNCDRNPLAWSFLLVVRHQLSTRTPDWFVSIRRRIEAAKRPPTNKLGSIVDTSSLPGGDLAVSKVKRTFQPNNRRCSRLNGFWLRLRTRAVHNRLHSPSQRTLKTDGRQNSCLTVPVPSSKGCGWVGVMWEPCYWFLQHPIWSLLARSAHRAHRRQLLNSCDLAAVAVVGGDSRQCDVFRAWVGGAIDRNSEGAASPRNDCVMARPTDGLPTWPRRSIVFLIELYRAWISPMRLPACRRLDG